MSLKFKLSTSKKDLQRILNYDSSVFSDTVDVAWDAEGLKSEIKNGWDVYSVLVDVETEDAKKKTVEEVIAVLFVKLDDHQLLTKNTPLKLVFQGQGISHKIKEFYEELARQNKVNVIKSYCQEDNFRAISLNETHGYVRTSEHTTDAGKVILEWSKKLK